MTIETDPRFVREIAETAFRSDAPGSPADRVEAALIASGVAGPVLSEKFDAYSVAIGAEYDRLAALARVREFCNRWVEIQPAGYDVVDGFPGVDVKLTISDLLAVLGSDN